MKVHLLEADNSSDSADPGASIRECPKPRHSLERPSLPFSIDWEDWFQLCVPPFNDPRALDDFPCRLPLATERTLELCAELEVHATWFCLADQARRHPSLIQRIVGHGHRIALHGLNHLRATEMNRTGFRQSLSDGRALLEDLAGVAVQGFRAPEWSLRGSAEDYWHEVRDLGFRYDASRAPLAILGGTGRSRKACELSVGFWEVPPPVTGWGALRVPLWGWGMRLLPEAFLRSRLRRMAMNGTPVVLHPWELDEAQPPLPGRVSLGHRFAHGAGLKGYEQRLRRLFNGVALTSIEGWLDAVWTSQP